MRHDPIDHPLRRSWADRLRYTLPLLAVILLAALATALMWTQQRSTGAAVEVASTAAEVARAPPGPAGRLPGPIDHSVVEQHSLPDEPEMTGASIGAYRP